ncbi:MAG TPA: hypothetical protein VEO96_08765 [Thermoplasmata archaeon]|nr:hypothetical protein [Thermoplasmata archaeon]
MRLGKSSTVALLLFLVSLNLLLRYPQTPHELDYDGFVFHGMTISLVQEGYAEWIIHPLSYFGLYPLSHPSGGLFALAGWSEVSGMSLEGAILLFDLAVVIVGLLGAFVLSMEIRRDEVLAFVVSAAFSLAPRFVTSLMWSVPARTLFTALIPLFIWLVLRWQRTHDSRYMILIPFVLLLMMSAHRLTVLMGILLIAFILTMVLLAAARTLRIRFASRVLSPSFRRISNAAVFGAFAVVLVAILVAGGVLSQYSSGQLGVGSGVLKELTNFGVSLTRSIGFLSPLVPLGIVVTYRRRAKEFKEPFLLMILVVIAPTLTLRQYTGFYIIPFSAVFIGVGLLWILEKMRFRVLKVAALAGAVVMMSASAVYVVGYDLQSAPYVDDLSYTHGLYVLYNVHDTVISNDGVLGSKIFLVSGHAYLPVGGATTAFQSPELLIFGFVDRSNLRIYPVPLADLTVDSDTPFSLDGVQAEADWVQILDHTPSSVPTSLWTTYSPRYLAESWDTWGGYTAYGKVYGSRFISAVHAENYKIFEIRGQTLWFVGGAT